MSKENRPNGSHRPTPPVNPHAAQQAVGDRQEQVQAQAQPSTASQTSSEQPKTEPPEAAITPLQIAAQGYGMELNSLSAQLSTNNQEIGRELAYAITKQSLMTGVLEGQALAIEDVSSELLPLQLARVNARIANFTMSTSGQAVIACRKPSTQSLEGLL